MTTDIVNANGQPLWMRHAWIELGEREFAGSATNPHIREFYQRAGHAEIADDEVPWCAAFVGACLERAGLTSTRSLMARSYMTWGEPVATPRPGCVAVFSRGTDPALGHVGFWIGETEDAVLLLGGNQNNAVSVEAIERTRLLGYRWPAASDDATSTEASSEGQPATDAEPVFSTALAHVLGVEGGYSNDPHDPGGPTNKGITLQDYARYRKLPLSAKHRDLLVRELKAIPDDQVRDIYRDFYWTPSHAADLPPGLALMHFDAAVNHGLSAAARFLQKAVGADADGEIGPLTLSAARAAPIESVLDRYADLRRERYRALGHFWRFGRGWLRRVDITLRHARELTGAVPPSPNSTASPISTEIGDPTMTNQTPAIPSQSSKWWGQSMTIWGVAITALSTVLPIIAPQLGLDVTPDMVRQLGDQSLQAAQAIGGLIGTVLAVYGRTRTSTSLVRREVRLQL